MLANFSVASALVGRRRGGAIERREGLPRAAASYRELPVNCRKWGKGRVAVRYHAVTEIGRNGGREGAAISYNYLPRNVDNCEKDGVGVNYHEVPEFGQKNIVEGLHVAPASC